MAVDIITIRTEPSNSGAGDTIKDAFDKTNTNFSVLRDVALRSDNIFPDLNDPTTARFANLQVTNRVLGNLFLNPGGQVFIFDQLLGTYQPVATASTTFPGGTVPGSALFTSLVGSISSATGALRVLGGVGVGGNIFADGLVFSEGGITSNNISESTTISTGAMVSNGGLGVAKSVNIGQTLTVAGTTTLNGGVVITSLTQVTNATPSTNPATGALRVTGGAGVLGNLNVGSDAVVSGQMTVVGDLTVAGNISFATETFAVSDNIMELHQPSGGGLLFSDDGKDVGINLRYFETGYGDSTAFIGWANNTGFFEYYDRGTEVAGVFVGDTHGVFRGGEYISVNNTVSTSTVTGAITTAGGIGAQGNIYSGGNVVASTGLVGPVYGEIITASQPNITTVGALTALTVSGNISNPGQFVSTQGIVADTVHAAHLGNVGTQIRGSVLSVVDAFLTNVTATAVLSGTVGNVGTNLFGTLFTASQPNVTTVGTLSSLNVSGAINSENGITASTMSAGIMGNVGAVIFGNLSAGTLANVSSDMTVRGSVTVTGNVIADYLQGDASFVTGNAASLNSFTATKLQTGVLINDQFFDGTQNISLTTVGVALAVSGANITGPVLANNLTISNLQQLGTLANLTVAGFANLQTSMSTPLVLADVVNAATIGNTGTVLTGTISTAAQPNITSVGTLGSLTVAGTVQASANATVNLGSATVYWNDFYTVTGNFNRIALGGQGMNSSGIISSDAGMITNSVSAATIGNVGAVLTGTVSTATQPNITSVGTLSSLTVSGNIAGTLVGPVYGTLQTAAQSNITTVGTLTALTVSGTAQPSANVTVDLGATNRYWNTLYASSVISDSINTGTLNVRHTLTVQSSMSTPVVLANSVSAATIGNSGAVLTGTISTAAQPNITSVGALTALTVSGSSTLANLATGTVNATTVRAVTIGNVGAMLTGTISTAAQPNITSVGSLSSLTVAGNVTATNISVTGQFSGPATGLTNIPSTQLTVRSITVTAGTGLTGGGTVDLGGTVTVNNGGVTSAVGTANQVLVNQATGAVTYSLPQNIHTNANPQFNSVLVAQVSKTGVNGTGDIGQSTNRFNNVWATTFSGTSVTAKYADLAEIYVPDQDYVPGTVVVFGGVAEITITSTHADVSVAGVISTNPAYLMNTEVWGLPVALRGRVPVRVMGPVQQGDLLVTSDQPGVAVSVGKDASFGVAVFAKALTHKTSHDIGVIEAVII